MTGLIVTVCVMSAVMSVGFFWCYRRGLNDGLKLGGRGAESTGVPMEPVEPVDPAGAIRQLAESIAAGVDDPAIADGIRNIAMYDGGDSQDK